MRFMSVVSLSAALLLSSTGHAQDKKLAVNEQAASSAAYQATTEAPAAAQAPAATEKKICKSLPVSGTRMFKRSCLTKHQWEQVEEQTK